jgi:uncharacterized protein YhhL (DUF1145 family)
MPLPAPLPSSLVIVIYLSQNLLIICSTMVQKLFSSRFLKLRVRVELYKSSLFVLGVYLRVEVGVRSSPIQCLCNYLIYMRE